MSEAAKRRDWLLSKARELESQQWTVPGVLRYDAGVISELLKEIEELKRDRDEGWRQHNKSEIARLGQDDETDEPIITNWGVE